LPDLDLLNDFPVHERLYNVYRYLSTYKGDPKRITIDLQVLNRANSKDKLIDLYIGVLKKVSISYYSFIDTKDVIDLPITKHYLSNIDTYNKEIKYKDMKFNIIEFNNVKYLYRLNEDDSIILDKVIIPTLDSNKYSAILLLDYKNLLQTHNEENFVGCFIQKLNDNDDNDEYEFYDINVINIIKIK
jgi:hypothetical protein